MTAILISRAQITAAESRRHYLRCVCLCHLPAGATAYEDRDSVLCNDCAAAEMER